MTTSGRLIARQGGRERLIAEQDADGVYCLDMVAQGLIASGGEIPETIGRADEVLIVDFDARTVEFAYDEQSVLVLTFERFAEYAARWPNDTIRWETVFEEEGVDTDDDW